MGKARFVGQAVKIWARDAIFSNINSVQDKIQQRGQSKNLESDLLASISNIFARYSIFMQVIKLLLTLCASSGLRENDNITYAVLLNFGILVLLLSLDCFKLVKEKSNIETSYLESVKVRNINITIL